MSPKLGAVELSLLQAVNLVLAGGGLGGLAGAFFDIAWGIPAHGVPRKELFAVLGALAAVGLALGLWLGGLLSE